MNRASSYRFPFARYPAVRTVLIFIGGVVAAKNSGIPLMPAVYCFTVLMLLLFVLELILSNKNSYLAAKITTFLFLVIIFSTGFIRFRISEEQGLNPAEQYMSVTPWEEVRLTGYVDEMTRNSKGRKRADFIVTKTEFSSGLTLGTKYKTRVIWDLEAEAKPGEQAVLAVTVLPVGERRNPLGFDYKNYLAARGIYTQVRADSILTLQKPRKNISWYTLRNAAIRIIDQNFDEKTAPVAKALLLGYKNELEGEVKAEFARAGLSHIMAVSGLHVGLVVAPFWIVIPWFWSRRYGPHSGLLLLAGLLYFYAGITGFSASVMRASLMALAFTYAKLFSKQSDSINVTAAAGLIILLTDPSQLFEIGFQLSFAAVLIILLVMPSVQAFLPASIRVRWYGIPVIAMIISVVVQFGIYPLQVYYFGEVSVISPVANALFVPALSIVVPLSMLSIFAAIVWPAAGFILNYPSVLFLKLLGSFVHYVSGFEWAWIKTGLPSGLLFLFWPALIFTVALCRNPRLRWKSMAAALSVLVVMQAAGIAEKYKPGHVEVIVFDVGQGDANLIKTPGGKYILIDTGIWNPNSDSGEQILLPYFKAAGITVLDAVILTHPHADHIGGIVSLLEGIKIEKIYNSGYRYESALYETYLRKAEELNVDLISVRSGDILEEDPAVLLLVLGPDSAERSNDPNQHSVIVQMVYGSTKFLFTGDAGLPQETRLLNTYGPLLNSDFLKAGHHGSRTSSGRDFLQAVAPEYISVSLADRNQFSHPHTEAVTRLYETDAHILFTPLEKGLVFESDGKSIRRKYWQ